MKEKAQLGDAADDRSTLQLQVIRPSDSSYDLKATVAQGDIIEAAPSAALNSSTRLATPSPSNSLKAGLPPPDSPLLLKGNCLNGRK
jgi:hypothetical protein